MNEIKIPNKISTLMTGIIEEEEIKFMTDFRKRREELNVTLREVEERIGISNAYLSQLERGLVTNPSFKIVCSLHNFYINKKKELKEKYS